MSDTKNPELAERLEREYVAAMKAQDKKRVEVLRFVRAAFKNKAIEKRGELTDEDILGVLSTQAKQRKESIDQFQAGGREDLAEKEAAELAIIQEFLPQQMSEAEVREIVQGVIEETGAASPKEMGKVMGALMPKVKGRADGKLVNQLVRELLAARAG